MPDLNGFKEILLEKENFSLVNRALLLSVIIPIFLMGVVKIGDYDVWFHLKAGEIIVSSGQINHLDPFAYTTSNLPWPVHSWLAAVIYYLVHGASGVGGLIIFNSLLITSSFFLIYLTMRLFTDDSEPFIIGAAALVIAAFAVRFRMWVRPHVFEFIFLASVIYILNIYRTKGVNRLYLLPVIQVLWANTHGSHVLGIIVPSIFLFGGAAQGLITRNTPAGVSVMRYAVTLAIVVAANLASTLINPDTYNTLISSFSILSPSMQNINEFQPLQLQHFWGFQLRYTWGFAAILILGAAGFIYNHKRFDLTDLLLFTAFLLMAVKGIRYIAEFAIVGSPIVFKNLSGLSKNFSLRTGRAFGFASAAVIFAVVTVLAVSSKTYAFGLGVKDRIFPEKAIQFIEKAGIKGNVFNSYAFGDYILWRTDRKVFIHGHNRSEVFPEAFYKEYLDAHASEEAWNSVAEKYGINYTLLEYYLTDYGGKEAVPHLSGNPDWTPVYWDGNAIIYVRNDGENSGVLEKYGLRLIRPTYLDFSYVSHYVESGISAALIKELNQLLAVSPENEEAYLARAFVLFLQGSENYPAAMADLKKAIEINPSQAMSHSAMGLIYLKQGDLEGAKASFTTALKFDPQDLAAMGGMDEIRRKEKR